MAMSEHGVKGMFAEDAVFLGQGFPESLHGCVIGFLAFRHQKVAEFGLAVCRLGHRDVSERQVRRVGYIDKINKIVRHDCFLLR